MCSDVFGEYALLLSGSLAFWSTVSVHQLQPPFADIIVVAVLQLPSASVAAAWEYLVKRMCMLAHELHLHRKDKDKGSR